MESRKEYVNEKLIFLLSKVFHDFLIGLSLSVLNISNIFLIHRNIKCFQHFQHMLKILGTIQITRYVLFINFNNALINLLYYNNYYNNALIN